jgi:hypothetical protein
MAKKQYASPDSDISPESSPGAQEGSSLPQREKPIHEIRIGKCKGVIWANHTENGIRHNVTIRRLFKRDSSAQWEQSDSFGRDDLPLVMEVARQAWLWIFDNAAQQG